ncbi:FxsA family protein [Fuscovulum ytuae]|uniref:FxsA family protein n=1 Tax=Fuscovulum ytuae TaxID=3042299 RepID=A0ABY8Q4I3_9RHOB|nr:FxsA family protein [Fuscovulum sp. YMD61]WGV15180.1 FxsA family protein [Fuscovulum sp. YMD61]
MPAIVVLLMWPLIEIALFVVVGGAIGLWWTLLIVVGTGIGGVVLLRRLGLSNATRLRGEMARMRDPVGAVGDGILKALAALLLILPGFLTDALGLLLLFSPVRSALISAASRKMAVVSMQSDQPARRSDGIVIDGEFVEVEADGPKSPMPKDRPSGWTRH